MWLVFPGRLPNDNMSKKLPLITHADRYRGARGLIFGMSLLYFAGREGSGKTAHMHRLALAARQCKKYQNLCVLVHIISIRQKFLVGSIYKLYINSYQTVTTITKLHILWKIYNNIKHI